MIFFYVGIGFAMLTSVVAIFETSTTITKNQSLTETTNSIQEDKLILKKQNDIIFLKMLDDLKGLSLGSGDEICQNIKDGFANQSNSNHSILSNYSVLNNFNYGMGHQIMSQINSVLENPEFIGGNASVDNKFINA